MRVLVTGASGFVGAWVCADLNARGYEIVGLSRRPQGEITASVWHQGDVTDLQCVETAARGCDAIVHLAVRAQTPSLSDPVADMHANALGTLQTLRAALAAGVRHVVYTSSSAVYGTAHGCLSEDAALLPVTPYGVSKAAGEAYCGMFTRAHGLRTTTLRLFNVFGRGFGGELRDTVECRFVEAVQHGQRPTLIGDPARAFDFVHVGDVAAAIAAALVAEQPAGSVINIGSGRATTLGELAAWCLDAAGMPGPPQYAPGPPAALPAYADLALARRWLGYAPQRELKTWVFETVHQL